MSAVKGKGATLFVVQNERPYFMICMLTWILGMNMS